LVGKLLEIENEGSICKHLVDAGLIHSLEGEECSTIESSFKLVEASVNLTAARKEAAPASRAEDLFRFSKL